MRAFHTVINTLPVSSWRLAMHYRFLLMVGSCIGVARGYARPMRRCPPMFLAYIVILCFEKQYPKQNSVIRLKSNIWLTQIFCAVYTTGVMHNSAFLENKDKYLDHALEQNVRSFPSLKDIFTLSERRLQSCQCEKRDNNKRGVCHDQELSASGENCTFTLNIFCSRGKFFVY